jgi:rare lipoprotein A
VRLRIPARPLLAGALSLTTTGVVAGTGLAQEPGPAAPPPVPTTAKQAAPAKPRITVQHRRLHVRAGERTAVRGRVLPVRAGLPMRLQARDGGRWVTLDRGRTRVSGRYALRAREHAAQSARVRVTVGRGHGVRRGTRTVGRLNVYRSAYASWYGPGLYGNHLGCGGTLNSGSLGVAHKTLPCGTKVTLRHNGRSVRVPVIDRGPYVGGREYDLTAATAQKLRFRGHGSILVTR